MLLCDIISDSLSKRSRPEKLGVPPALAASPIFETQMDQLAGISADLGNAVRYAAGEDVIAASTGVLASRPSSMRAAMSFIRFPHHLMWIEWLDGPRNEARKAYGVSRDSAADAALRVGCLIRSDENGRTATAEFVWIHPDQVASGGFYVPKVCPVGIRINLDDVGASKKEGAQKTDMYRRWQSHPEEIEAIDAIETAGSYYTTEQGKQIISDIVTASGNAQNGANFLEESFRDLQGEFLQLIAVIMLMNARNALVTQREDRGKLNKSRARSGKVPLMDHLVTYMKLTKGEMRAGIKLGDGGRAHRRAHMVSGHFVVRKNTVFWRREHQRGGMPGDAPLPKLVKLSL